ncbi:peptidase MA family metallohydrolase [Candidatus Neomarinimicrobiota bacterium]
MKYPFAGVFLWIAATGVLYGVSSQGGYTDSIPPFGPLRCDLGDYALFLPSNYDEDSKEYLVELVSDVALGLISRFGPVNKAPFQLVVVNTREQLEKWVGGTLPDWIHAVALERPSRVVILGPGTDVADPSRHNFEQALLHELTHVYLYSLAPHRGTGPFPGWFHEGLAVHISSGLDRGMHRAIVRGRLTRSFYTLAELERIYHRSSDLSELAYAQSVVAVQSMEQFYGEGIFRFLFDELRMNGTFESAFMRAADESLSVFKNRYQQELFRRYNLLLVLADPLVWFILLPILVLLAYFIRLWRNRIIKARWRQELAALESHTTERIDPNE